MQDDVKRKPKRKAPSKHKKWTITQAQAIIIAALITTVIGGFFAIQAAVQPVKLGINTTQTVESRLTTLPNLYASSTALSNQITATTNAFSTLISATEQSVKATSQAYVLTQFNTPQPTAKVNILPQAGTPIAKPPSDPQIFVLWYFDTLLKTRDYDYVRTFQSASFQSATGGNSSEFADFWDLVEKLEITQSVVLQRQTDQATIGIRMTFYFKDGRILSNRDYVYDVTYNQQLQTWQFDYR